MSVDTHVISFDVNERSNQIKNNFVNVIDRRCQAGLQDVRDQLSSIETRISILEQDIRTLTEVLTTYKSLLDTL